MIATVTRHPSLIQLLARAGVDPTRHSLTVFDLASQDWSSATEAAALAGSPLLAAVSLGLGWAGMIAAGAAHAAAP